MMFITEETKELLIYRSNFISEVIKLFENKQFDDLTKKITLEIKDFLNDDDPYYIGFLYSVLIQIYLKREDVEKVVLYTNKILEFSGMVLYEYCGKYTPFEKKTLDEVLKCYDKLIENKNVNAMWGKARILHFKNEWKNAHKLYDEAVKLEPDNAMLLRMYGRLYEDECKFSNALGLYNKIKDKNSDPLIECFIANVYIKLGNLDYAIDILKSFLWQNPANTVALFRLYNVLYMKDKRNEAEEIQKKLLKLCPYNTKYILYSQKIDAQVSLQLFKNLHDVLSVGFDYSIVEKFIGDFYFNKHEYEKATEHYKKTISKNPFYLPAYTNIFLSLMNLTKDFTYGSEKNKKFEQLREKIISQAKSKLPYDLYLINDCENVVKTLEIKISSFEGLKEKYPDNINFYLILCDLYEEAEDKEKLTCCINEICLIFPESYYGYIKELDLLLEDEKYQAAYDCLKKINAIINLHCKKTYVNEFIENLQKELLFVQKPDNFYEIEQGDDLRKSVYKDLITVYYNLSYQDKKYLDIAFYCISKAEIDFTKEDPSLLYIISLIYAVKEMHSESQNIFDSIFTNKCESKISTNDNSHLTLIDMIKIIEDILDIKYLYKLFINCKFFKDDFFDQKQYKTLELKELYFYQNILLFLIHIKYIKNNSLTKKISHYTSIKTLSFMLDDNNTSPLRLYTLNSANDTKEGKILFDYLSLKIQDKNIINKIHEKGSPKICAVQTSFTLLKDALTMFRLYGKDKGKEGTGVNLIFKSSYFSDKPKPPTNKCTFDNGKQEDNPDENIFQQRVIDYHFIKLPLFFVLYYDSKRNYLIFNPFDIFRSSVINLNSRVKWTVINQNKISLKDNYNLRRQYLNNIAFVFRKMQNAFSKISIDEVVSAKELLLNISYLVKDASFVDGKELRMIKIDELNSSELKHDNDTFSLYRDYMTVIGENRYGKQNYLEEIILGPKVEQKDTVAEYFVNHLNKLEIKNVPILQSNAPLA